MKKLNTFIAESEDIIYVVKMGDDTFVQFFDDENEAKSLKDKLNSEDENNHAKVSKEKRSEYIKEDSHELTSDFINEGFIDGFKNIFKISKPKTKEEAIKLINNQCDKIIDEINKFDSENYNEVKSILNNFSSLTSNMADNMWDIFDDIDKLENPKIDKLVNTQENLMLKLWQSCEQICDMMYLYVKKLKDIKNKLQEN